MHDVLAPELTTNRLLGEHQLTTELTRITAKSQTLINHCCVSCPCSFISTGVAALAESDHQLIFLTQDIATGVKSSTSMCREVRFQKCSMNSLLDDLSNAPWSTMGVFNTVDDKESYCKTLILKVVNKHAQSSEFKLALSSMVTTGYLRKQDG